MRLSKLVNRAVHLDKQTHYFALLLQEQELEHLVNEGRSIESSTAALRNNQAKFTAVWDAWNEYMAIKALNHLL